MQQAGRVAVWDSTLLRTCAVVAGVSVLWFAVVLIAGPVGPILPGWLLSPVAAALAFLIARQTGADPLVPEPARLFWRRIAIPLAFFAVAMASFTVDSTHADLSIARHLSPHSAALQA